MPNKWDNVPLNVRKYILDFVKGGTLSSTCYIRTNDVIDGELVLRTWAFKNTKGYGLEIQEILREYLSHNEVKNLYYSHIGGYIVDFEREERSYYMDPNDTWGETDNNWKPGIQVMQLVDYEEVERLLQKKIPYFKLDYNVIDIMEYSRAYQTNPCVELLGKAGFGYLYGSKALFKLTDKKKKICINWMMKNKEQVIKYRPSFQFIREAAMNNKTFEQEQYLADFRFELKRVKQELDQFKDRVSLEEITSFIQKKDIHIMDYRDYLIAANGIGKDIGDRGVLFPHDFQYAHDTTTKAYDEYVNKAANEKLGMIKSYLDAYVVQYKDLRIVVPGTQNELSQLGNKLHNCVGSYTGRICGNDCYVVAVFLGDNPIECCELKLLENGKIKNVQLRGDKNLASDRHEDCEKIINKFIQNYKPVEVQA